MKMNNIDEKMVKKLLVLTLLILSLSSISAFCTVQGYVLDSEGNSVNASKINIVCKRADGEILYTQPYGEVFGFPFADWYDDCSYCDQGIYINGVDDLNNRYGEISNLDCVGNELKTCHIDISLENIPEGEGVSASSKDGYSNSIPDVGPLVEEQKPMPKSNESPETKIKGIKEKSNNYTPYYLGVCIIGIILIITALKYGKK
jgi:hypothetical protein